MYKRWKPSNYVCFTYYPAPGREPTPKPLLVKESADWWLWGEEICPTTQRVHLQGMAYSKTNRDWKLMRKSMHAEATVDGEASLRYCTKDQKNIVEAGTRPTEWPKPRPPKKRMLNSELLKRPLNELVDEELIPLRGLKRLKEDIDLYTAYKALPSNATDCKGIWIYGDAGCGKSYAVRNRYPDCFLKAQNKWWDGYKGQDSVLLDDFDRQGVCLSHYLKIWADRWTCTAEVKGSTIPLSHSTFIITSNYTINDLFPIQSDPDLNAAISRRFKEVQMTISPTGVREMTWNGAPFSL